jgi:NAD binding domain of 6-phosphogluconate dehydrogenase
MTSTPPTAGKLLAEAAEALGIGVLNAPVGGIPAAEAGTLQMFVGGDAERRNPSGREPSGELRDTGKFRKDLRKRPG